VVCEAQTTAVLFRLRWCSRFYCFRFESLASKMSPLRGLASCGVSVSIIMSPLRGLIRSILAGLMNTEIIHQWFSLSTLEYFIPTGCHETLKG